MEICNPAVRSLDGKRIIFIGNSFIYYGNCVIDKMRDGDVGYFFQLARSNGEDVSVYNYTYGGRNLRYIYENHLSKEPPEFLLPFDIVFVSEAGENNPYIMRELRNIKSLFSKDASFFYLCHEYTHRSGHNNIISAFPKMREEGFTVVDWGGLVYRIWNSLVPADGSDTYYTRQTFIKDNKGKVNGKGSVGEGKPGDNHHQNPLSGYLCALMAYCAASGRQALGQPYEFCFDKSIHPYFDIDNFTQAHYSNRLSTNMPEIFRSNQEMRFLQSLIDKKA